MKKSFKRAGVAVLSMAMLLSMGAVAATSASAAAGTVQVKSDTNLKAGDTVRIYKVADVDTDGKWKWTGIANSIKDDLPSFATLGNSTAYPSNSDAIKQVASQLARAAVGQEPLKTTTVDAAAVSVDAGKGYYLIVPTCSEAGKIVQPILKEIKDDDAAEITDTKASTISLDKIITAATEGGTVATGGKSAQVESGAVVTYQLKSQLPHYDDNVTAAVVKPFTLVDTCDSTLTIDTTSVNVYLSDDASLETETDTKLNNGDVLSGASATGFTVTIGGNTLLTNKDKYVYVTFTATLGADPTLATGETDRSDANKNDVVLTYANDYATGGYIDTDNDGDQDDETPPTLTSYADVYTTAYVVNKYKETTSTVFPNVSFSLYKYDSDVQGDLVKTDVTGADGKLKFVGLDAGKYQLVENSTAANAGYKIQAPIVFTISNDASYSAFVSSLGALDATEKAFKSEIVNEPQEALPGTGGIGTTLFTVGGAAIVLVAGFMFVMYMKKRGTEEE